MKRYMLFLLLATGIAAHAQPVVVIREQNVENAYPRLSEDGRQVLYQSNKTGKWQLYLSDINGSNRKSVTSGQHNNNFPDWSQDNSLVAFVSDRDGNEELYISKTDGSGLKRLTTNTARDIHPYFSPDGRYLLFNSDRDGSQFDIYRYNLQTGATQRLTNTPDNETCARYAPDMKSIVLLKNSEEADDVYLMHMPAFTSTNLSRTPNVYHGWPMFGYNGKWIYYSSMEGGTYSIYRIKADGSGKQQLTHAPNGEEHARVNVSKDGRFMIYNIKSGKTISIVKEQLPG